MVLALFVSSAVTIGQFWFAASPARSRNTIGSRATSSDSRPIMNGRVLFGNDTHFPFKHRSPRSFDGFRFEDAPSSAHYLMGARAAVTSTTTSQSGNSIGGTVLDSSRRPVPDLYVELLDEVERSIQRTRTDGTGRYAFRGLPQGTFYVRVQTFGTNLASQTVRVTLFNASVGATTGRYQEEVSFNLKTVDEEKTRSSPRSSPATVFSQEVPEPARTLYEEAIQVLNDGKGTDQGIDGLKRAIEIFPTYYQALDRLGAEYVKLKQYDLALEPLRKAVEVNAKGSGSLHTLGVALYNLKRLNEAIDSLRRAVSIAPNSANSQFWLGIVLFRSGKKAEAEAPLTRAYQLAGKQVPDVHMYLAQIYSDAKRYKEAADELELFLKDSPDARDAQNIKALIAQLRAKANRQ